MPEYLNNDKIQNDKNWLRSLNSTGIACGVWREVGLQIIIKRFRRAYVRGPNAGFFLRTPSVSVGWELCLDYFVISLELAILVLCESL